MATRFRPCRFSVITGLMLILIFSCILLFTFLMVMALENSSITSSPLLRNYFRREIDFSDVDNATVFATRIVPNIVHFIKFRSNELEFVEMVNIKAVHRNHHPEKIYIHCSCDALRGKYWEMVRHLDAIEVKYLKEPTHVFGKRISSVYHASDVARIKLMMEYGGIFLDGDVYVVQSLNDFLHFEFSLGWPEGEYIGTQVLIGHKNARFLKLWHNSYKWYKPYMWYYNAGQLPTESILEPQPWLVHRVPRKFGVHYMINELYKEVWSEWVDYYTIHLLTRHREYLDEESHVQRFNEENIKKYNFTFGEMARLILYGTKNFV